MTRKAAGFGSDSVMIILNSDLVQELVWADANVADEWSLCVWP